MVIYEVANRVATITIDRAEKSNAFNPELVAALTEALARAESDATVKVIVLKAAGEVFSAGADLAYLQQLEKSSYEENLQDSRNLGKLFSCIARLPKVVIAQIEGHAIAGGCGLATVCDFSFTVPEAKFGFTEVRLGFVPAIVGSFVVHKLGIARASELLLRGHLISADEAVKLGLINFISGKEQIEADVQQLADELCVQASGNSLAVTKHLLLNIQYQDFEAWLDQAAQENAKVRSSDDFKKGIASFLKKEQINW